MKKFIVPALLAIIMASVPGCACNRINPGQTGVLYDSWGKDRGTLDAIQEKYGFVQYNPLQYDLHVNDNYVQRNDWSGESGFKVMSKDNLGFGIDLSLSWYVNPAPGCSARLFRKYKVPARDLANGEIRSILQDRLQNTFGRFTSDEVSGERRNDMLDDLNRNVRTYFGNIRDVDGTYLRAPAIEQGKPGDPCLKLDNVRLLQLRMPQAVSEAATARAGAAQAAQKMREELVGARYLAEADSVRAHMQAVNNRLLSESITDQLIRYTLAQGLADGKFVLPRVSGGENPLSFIISEE